MEKIGNYGVYQNYYSNTAQAKSSTVNKTGTEKVEAEKASAAQEPVELSENAKSLLKELQQKYGNMDFIIAKYETDEEASALLAKGTKEYSVLIDPETLEKMAADEEEKKKYLGILEDATGKLGVMKAQMSEEDQANVKSMGVSISDDGTVSYFAELEKSSAQQRERIEEKREEKKEAAAKEEKANEKKAEEKRMQERIQKTRVQSDSIDGLLEQIRNVDWNTIKPEAVAVAGGRFDYTI